MDALLEIIVPTIPSVEGLVKYEPQAEWLGVTYPQAPALYRWGSHVELRPDIVLPWISKFLPAEYIKNDWNWMEIAGDGLDLLELEVNGKTAEWNGWHLCDLLCQVLTYNKSWVLNFMWHHDQIDRTYCMDVEGAVQKLKSNLRWEESREGFLIHAR